MGIGWHSCWGLYCAQQRLQTLWCAPSWDAKAQRRHGEGTVKWPWKEGKSSWIMMIMQDFVYWYIFLYVFVCGLYMYPELATRESRFFLGLEYTSWISFTIACSFFESTLKATIARSQETSSSSIWGNSLPRQVCPQNSVLYLCFWEYLNISDFTPQNPVWHFDLWGARAFCILESGGVLVDGVENVKLQSSLWRAIKVSWPAISWQKHGNQKSDCLFQGVWTAIWHCQRWYLCWLHFSVWSFKMIHGVITHLVLYIQTCGHGWGSNPPNWGTSGPTFRGHVLVLNHRAGQQFCR